MGTHRSKHNKGRKPVYKDHRTVAAHLLAHPWCMFGDKPSWAKTRTWWTDTERFKVEILAEANSDIEGSADALGRSPTSVAHQARDLRIVLPPQWSRLIAKKKGPQLREVTGAYPYIAVARDEHADLLAVNNLIPKGIPDHMRADICQEVMLAIYEGRTTLEALKARQGTATYYIKKFYHDNYENGGHAISFQDTDNDWDGDAVASSIAAKEWREDQMREDRRYSDIARRTFTAPTQFEAAWKSQVGRAMLTKHQLGEFLSFEETEELLESEQ